MSRKILPYYPLYVHDFDEDAEVMPMTLDEVGLYVLALNEGWKRGSIPDDPKALALAIRRDQKDVRRAWPTVRRRWIENGTPGRLVNKRQEIERARAVEKSEKAAHSASARYANATQTHSDGTAPAVLRVSESVSSLETTGTKQENTTTRARVQPWQADETYGRLRERHNATGALAADIDWAEAYRSWIILDPDQKQAAIEYIGTIDPAFMPRPLNYLRKHEWTRPPRPAPKSKLEKLMDSI